MTPTPESTVDPLTIEDDSETLTSCKEKCKEWLHGANLFFQDVANIAIKFFNDMSDDYRSITSQLALERKERARSFTNDQSVSMRMAKNTTDGEIVNDMVSFTNTFLYVYLKEGN